MWTSFRKRCSTARSTNEHISKEQYNSKSNNVHVCANIVGSEGRRPRVSWIPGLKQENGSGAQRRSPGVNTAKPPSPSTSRRRRFRRISSSRPDIRERESSLYAPTLDKEDDLCSPSSASFFWEATSPFDIRTQNSTFYGLPLQAQSVFDLPSPSGKRRLTLLDVQSHEDIWEQVFDSAARCSFYRQSAPQAAHWKPWTTSLDLPSTRGLPSHSMAQIVVEGEGEGAVEWRNSFEPSTRSTPPPPGESTSPAPSRPVRSALRHATSPAADQEAEPLSSTSLPGRYQPRPSVVAAFDRFNELDITSPVFSQTTPTLNHYPSPVLEEDERDRPYRLSTYQLAVDKPLPEEHTPPLSASSSDEGHTTVYTPKTVMPLAPVELPSFTWRKRSTPQSRDPLKIRDGVAVKNSNSGVYTPATFPGPQGPPVLAPPIVLDSRAGPPSRSGSLSSAFSDASSSLQTPQYSPNRASFSSVARASFSGIGRRMSSLSVMDKRGSVSSSLYVTTGHPDGAASAVPPYSAPSMRTANPGETSVTSASRPTWGSYFSWGPSSSPANVSTPTGNPGLGLGALVPPPRESSLISPDHSVETKQALAMDEFGSPGLEQGTTSPGTSNGSLGNKSKRKPVPRLLDEEKQIPDEEGGEEMIDFSRRREASPLVVA